MAKIRFVKLFLYLEEVIVGIVEDAEWNQTTKKVQSLILDAVGNNHVRALQAMRFLTRKYFPENEHDLVDSMDEATLLFGLTSQYFNNREKLDMLIATLRQSVDD